MDAVIGEGLVSGRISRRLAILAVLGGAVVVACGASRRSDGGQGPLPVGARAPDFNAVGADGLNVSLASVRGTRIVYFYPKDETPGCTKEACAFRDAFDRYKQAGATIFGVSRDSEESHRKFREHHSLPFPLASDESGEIQKAYGVPSRLGVMASRMTFVVDASGKITHVFEQVDPAVHADEVLAVVKK